MTAERNKLYLTSANKKLLGNHLQQSLDHHTAAENSVS
jgi:hypothetical protein